MWENITDIITPKGKQRLVEKMKKREKPVLVFDYEGSRIYLRIMRITNKKVWAKKTYLYTEDEADDEVGVEKSFKN